MVYRYFHTLGGGTKKKTEPHWEKGPGEPEEELSELLSSIRTRVYTLKTVVEEQSKEIESTLNDTQEIVDALPHTPSTERIEQVFADMEAELDRLHPEDRQNKTN
jgi:hypothetical protein